MPFSFILKIHVVNKYPYVRRPILSKRNPENNTSLRHTWNTPTDETSNHHTHHTSSSISLSSGNTPHPPLLVPPNRLLLRCPPSFLHFSLSHRSNTFRS